MLILALCALLVNSRHSVVAHADDLLRLLESHDCGFFISWSATVRFEAKLCTKCQGGRSNGSNRATGIARRGEGLGWLLQDKLCRNRCMRSPTRIF